MGSFEHKFPRTSHLFGSRSTRDDRVLSESQTKAVLAHALVVQEKIDGANVGISFEPNDAHELTLRVQNRGHFLGPGDHAQYGPLWPFVYERLELLKACLGETHILFGEWCYARHSCFYDKLPSYFLAFDLYDKSTKSFATQSVLASVCERVECERVPTLAEGVVLKSTKALDKLIGPSAFGPERAEGVYLRLEDKDKLVARYKWVRSDFIAGIQEHWQSRPLEPNRLR
jgi:hypothetical protein